MGQHIIHHKGAYNFYTTVADGACFVSAITLEQLIEYTKEKFGERGIENLQARLDRAHKTGTSSLMHYDLHNLLICNRAGKNEKSLNDEDFIKRFLTL